MCCASKTMGYPRRKFKRLRSQSEALEISLYEKAKNSVDCNVHLDHHDHLTAHNRRYTVSQAWLFCQKLYCSAECKHVVILSEAAK